MTLIRRPNPAHFENGLLKLSIPKAEEAEPRQIRIKPVQAGAESPTEQAMSGPGA